MTSYPSAAPLLHAALVFCGGALGLAGAGLLLWHALVARPAAGFWRRAAGRLRCHPAATLNTLPLLVVLAWAQMPALGAVFRPPPAAVRLPSAWQLLAMPLTMDAVLLAAVWACLRLGGLSWSEMRKAASPSCSGGRALRAGLRGGAMMLAPVWALAAAAAAALRGLGWPEAPQDALLLLLDGRLARPARAGLALIAVVVAPAVEETVFRGVLLPATARLGSPWRSVVLTSLLFAAIHLHAGAFLPLFGFSLACSLGFMATGRLLTPIIMHALFNAVSIAGHLAGLS
jgi:membrane protease YdiL (CAAX protease family)